MADLTHIDLATEEDRRYGIKDNTLRVYDYLEYLIDELAKHAEDTSCEFFHDLLPWAQAVQENAKITKNLNASMLIYEIASKMAVSLIVWYPCLTTYRWSSLIFTSLGTDAGSFVY